MKDEKQAALAAIQQINAVDGFDPSPLAVEYADLNTHEKRLRLPVMGQLAWFWLKHPEGRVAVTVTPAKECFIATARIYANYTNPSDQYLAEATAVTRLFAGQADGFPVGMGTDSSNRPGVAVRWLWTPVRCGRRRL